MAAQRAALERLVDPGDAEQQSDCPVAHHTLRLEPVYSDLRRPPTGSVAATSMLATSATPTSAAPTSATGSGSLAPTAYLLPTLITIFTGDRITGTDLTTLRLFVAAGAARIGPLCVN